MSEDLIPENEIKELREELYSATNPVYFFDDDPDGLSSFLIFYKCVQDGKGIPIKSSPVLDVDFSSKVHEYSPDKVFILDKPEVTQDFIDSLKNTPVVWLDHHPPIKLKHVKYFNPRVHHPDKHKPTTYWAYMAADDKKLLWIAAVGCVGDWYIPDFIDEFVEKYPDLLEKRPEKPDDILFESGLGELVKVFSFLLKGKTSEVIKCMKIMTRIKTPYEILQQETPQGRYIFKRYMKIKHIYDEILQEAISQDNRDDLLVYRYSDNKMSFTADLSNELLHRYPEKIIVIAREKNGEMKCSLRSGEKRVDEILEKSLLDVEGYGGGHEHACGACVQKKDFEQFLENLKKNS